MEVSYFDRLPSDLTYLLALKLGWWELYLVYCRFQAFRRYDDPQHRLWVELYHRDLSSYVPATHNPKEISYRDQYFWGHHHCVNLHRQSLTTRTLSLATLGYDRMISQIPLRSKWILDAAKAAVERGYLIIVNLLVPHVNPHNLPALIRLADRSGFTELGDELRSLHAHHFPALHLRIYGPSRFRP